MIYKILKVSFIPALVFHLVICSELFSQKLYFCEEYKDGKEIGVSDEFIISPGGGYFTCMLDLRGTGTKIGTEKVSLKIWKYAENTERKFEAEEKFDVQSDWDYIYFDKFHTFNEEGRYFVEALLPDGSQVAVGDVSVKMKTDIQDFATNKTARIYFCEKYEHKEIGVSNVFYISPLTGGTFTAMLDMRNTGATVGSNSITLKIVKTYGKEEIFVANEKFDVESGWDYVYFSDFHDFRNAGKYVVTAMTREGNVLGSGTVEVRVR